MNASRPVRLHRRRTARRMAAFLVPAMLVPGLCATPLCAAEVYKTTDAEGHVVYTDHADPKAPQKAIQVDTSSAKQAARIAKAQAQHKAEDVQHRKQLALEAAKMAKLDRDAKMECDDAQKKFFALKADGNPGAGADPAAARKREAARQAMIIACTD
jgi:hypothetical protein